MHRHGFKGRKFNRETDARSALIKGLAENLILHESIETTVTKAKELLPYVEKLITKAKKNNLHNRRQIIASLQTLEAAHKLVDDIAPKLKGRVSGHLRIEKTDTRRGDNAQMATISFVDDLNATVVKTAAEPEVDPKSKKSSSEPSTSAVGTVKRTASRRSTTGKAKGKK